jgi:regulation of enolase protein 1 (concanavalin A-like superfamily)
MKRERERAMQTERRKFLEQSLLVTCATIVGAPTLTAASPVGADMKTDLMGRMKWMNEPASWKKSGESLVVRSRAKTDFWRKTFYGYITDNGHFFYLPVSGDFVFQARINGQYAALYDQAGLMVRADAENWMKCGTEFFDGERHASVVFTRDFSDWSTMPDLSKSAPIWWRAVRKKDSIETLCSSDGKKFISVRQGYFVPGAETNVGIMCAAPEGPGFEAVFDDLRLEIG